MNVHCETCAIEEQCGYEYKPCDCCNYRKFKPLKVAIEPTLEEARQMALLDIPLPEKFYIDADGEVQIKPTHIGGNNG